jgi:hypothetical protein
MCRALDCTEEGGSQTWQSINHLPAVLQIILKAFLERARRLDKVTGGSDMDVDETRCQIWLQLRAVRVDIMPATGNEDTMIDICTIAEWTVSD